MKRARDDILLSINEIDTLIRHFTGKAHAMASGREQDCVLETISQLKRYADAKRWIEWPRLE